MPLNKRNAGPPDFVGVGAQRSGTTWWFELLLEHPAIRLSRRERKELHYFDRFCARAMEAEDVRRYHRLFPRRAGSLTGEWTPRYMYDPWTPRLLARAAPEAKLLVLLRDPIERFRSGFEHQRTLRPKQKVAHVAADAIDRGRYARQLQRLWEFFAPEQTLVLQYERCRVDTLGQYARTLRFLGLPDDFRPPGTDELRGTTMASAKAPLWPDLRDDLHAALHADVRELEALVPDLDLELWPNFATREAVAPSG